MATEVSNNLQALKSRLVTVGQARVVGQRALEGVSESPGLDSSLLLEEASGLSSTKQIASSTEPLDAAIAFRFLALLRRRITGEPIAYILGRKGFRTIELTVDQRVLVPRPETELLVDVGLIVVGQREGSLRLVDMGTGSGAVALALASEIPRERLAGIEIIASDISQGAIQVAAINREALGLEHAVEFSKSDLFLELSGSFDLVFANLPYLRSDQRHPSTAHEPGLALFAGEDGLDVYRQFMRQANDRIRPGGIIACEIDPSQTFGMLQLARRNIGEAAVLKDLAGRDRIILAGAVDIVRTVADTWSYGA